MASVLGDAAAVAAAATTTTTPTTVAAPLLSADELQAITLKASYVYEHADRPYFRREVNEVAARLREQPHLGFFVRYRSDKHDASLHRWSRIRRVVYLSASDEAAAAAADGANATTPSTAVGSDNNTTATPATVPQQYMLWRNKAVWVALQVVGEERPVYLPMLSAKPPTDAEVMAYCTRQANHSPDEVYVDGNSSSGSTSNNSNNNTSDSHTAAPTAADSTAVFPDILLPSPPRVYLPTVQQIAKLKRYRLQHITQHAWTPGEIAEARALHESFHRASSSSSSRSKRGSATADDDGSSSGGVGGGGGSSASSGSAAAVVAATLNTQHNLRLEMQLEQVTRSGGMLWHMSQDTTTGTPTTSATAMTTAAAAAMTRMPASSPPATRDSAFADVTATSAASAASPTTPSSHVSTPLLSPFLPRRVQERVLARYRDGSTQQSSSSSNAATAVTPSGSPLHNASMYSEGGYMASANASFNDSLTRAPSSIDDASLSQTMNASSVSVSSATATTTATNSASATSALSAILDESAQRWREMAATERAFYHYVSDAQRSAYLNKIADISRRNSLANKRSRLRGIANERRLERKGNLLESSGLWVTDDRERARKAARYKASLEEANDAAAAGGGGGGGNEQPPQQQQQQQSATAAATGAHDDEDDAWLQSFRARRAQQQQLDLGALPADLLQLMPDTTTESVSGNDDGNDAKTTATTTAVADDSDAALPPTSYRDNMHTQPRQRQNVQSQLLFHSVARTARRLTRRCRSRHDAAGDDATTNDGNSGHDTNNNKDMDKDDDDDMRERAAPRRRVEQ